MRQISTLCITVIFVLISDVHGQVSLNANPDLQPESATSLELSKSYQLIGNAVYDNLGVLNNETTGYGVRFMSSKTKGNSAQLRTTVHQLSDGHGMWYQLQIEALAWPEFKVENENLYLKVEFLKNKGKTSLDHIKHRFYAQIEKERNDLKDSGTNRKLGHSTWRTYSVEFKIPFGDIDTLVVSVGCEQAKVKSRNGEFWVNKIELIPIVAPATYTPPKQLDEVTIHPDRLRSIGGRWYFIGKSKGEKIPVQFDYRNANQLLYYDGRYSAPFANNTSAWLRKGYKDINGQFVKEDKYIPDNVVITYTKTHLVIQSKNLPNHPTAQFPDRTRLLDGNPNYIAEQNATWKIPFAPKRNPNAVAMKNENNNDNALPMGPIGVATNGVIFFNPFDHILDEDAVWRLDRCCGHPSPRSQYHYHKYPVCIKSPFSDNGEQHSPVIGFAFDGYPVYGPYEDKNTLARESKINPLNAFNVHHDEKRGWHYHVTPGQFPHIIGGYWGVVDVSNSRRRGPGAGGNRNREGEPSLGRPDRFGPPPVPPGRGGRIPRGERPIPPPRR